MVKAVDYMIGNLKNTIKELDGTVQNINSVIEVLNRRYGTPLSDAIRIKIAKLIVRNEESKRRTLRLRDQKIAELVKMLKTQNEENQAGTEQ